MYLAYFGFRIRPFENNLDLRFLVELHSARTLVEYFSAGKQVGERILLVAPSGYGKSFLARHLIALFGGKILTGPFGLDDAPDPRETLFVDNVREHEIRSVLDRTERVDTVIVLTRRRCENFPGITIELPRIHPDEIGTYLNTRMAVAECPLRPFDESVGRYMARRSAGCPMLLNRIADRALAAAFIRKGAVVTGDDVDTAVSEINLTEPNSTRRPRLVLPGVLPVT